MQEELRTARDFVLAARSAVRIADKRIPCRWDSVLGIQCGEVKNRAKSRKLPKIELLDDVRVIAEYGFDASKA